MPAMVTLLRAAGGAVEAVDPSQVWIGPGLLGFVVIMALVVGTVFLWRNMNKQLRKVNERYGDAGSAGPAEEVEGPEEVDGTVGTREPREERRGS